MKITNKKSPRRGYAKYKNGGSYGGRKEISPPTTIV